MGEPHHNTCLESVNLRHVFTTISDKNTPSQSIELDKSIELEHRSGVTAGQGEALGRDVLAATKADMIDTMLTVIH